MQIDSFNFQSALVLAQYSQPPGALATLVAGDGILLNLYADARTSLLNKPSSYLSRLHAAVTPYPFPFSSSVMSQATGFLLGYQSLVSQDVLGVKPTQGPITPGMSINIGPAATGGPASPSGTVGVAQASKSTGATLAAGSTSSSKGAGMPAASANPQMIVNAAAAAMLVLGAAIM